MDCKINKDYIWEPIEAFNSNEEYLRFFNWLQEQVLNNEIIQIPVSEYYAGSNLDEYWFKNEKGAIWRLVAPDFPFEGYWGPV